MITYGYSVQEGSDHFVNLADTVMSNFALAGSPGTFMVDIVPVLQYLPKWLPGMRGYWKTMASWRKETELMFDEPYQFAKAQFKNNGIVPSLVSLLLESEISCTDEANIKLTAGSLYGAGADTTVSANYSFLLAMTLNSSIQAKAQEEIDKVIGNSRLPTIADRDNLPYINALVKEVFRWNSITPLGMPHRVIRDDIHKGYFIPKGSTVIVNAWHLLHDPDVYADPLSFNPNRFLGDNPERDPRKIVFGFGRRICPGICSAYFGFTDDSDVIEGLNLADTSVFIFCALSLAVFNVSKVVRDGVVVEPICEWETGVVSHPKDFECSIKPRSAKARELILMEEDSLK
ncbi:hypothetical protein QCA50_014552 [Cerrena zonata]|uniref:Cytochrome P450 n=1 Tax=Cerrena zonata TaxID=2478898 RepID=A0AAW0FYH0_9APHY